MKRLLLLVAVLLLPSSTLRAAAPFELKDGDRVVFLGDTLMEREQHYGWIELMLTTRFPDRNVTFRNLGWSADLPNGESRLGLSLGQAGNEPAGEGWMLLQKQLEETKPTVAFIGYGMAASFAGEAGLPKFKADYERLLDTIEKLSPGCRFVLLGPVRHLWVPGPLPSPHAHNAQLKAYSQSIGDIAKARNLVFVSLFDSFKEDASATDQNRRWAENGIHLTEDMYFAIAAQLQGPLGYSTKPQDLAWMNRIPQSNLAGIALRAIILRKNEFFFHRSRPANMAYIFGFRKREQGRNAVEIPQFDRLIAAEEKKIRELCKHLKDRNFKPGPELQPAKLLDKPAAAKFTPQPRPEFTVADGFEVTLWAENPLLAKPIQMNFDPQGRLWVASSEVYPQVEPGQAAHDKIIVLEDTTGAGKADKHTVFADGLLIPTGVIPGDGGCYVAQSTELLHLKDTNGDGKADVRRIVLSSFGTEDTHHNLHTLRWGPDGRLWMNQSIYTRSEIETPHGVVRLRSGGVFRLDTRTLELDVPFRGWVNAWGHQFDEFGQSFVTDGAGFKGINWAMPGATYFTYARLRRELQSISPGNYPKFASIEIIYSTHFPADWQGRVVTCDFRANRVTTFFIEEQGAGYVTKQGPDLLRTANNTFRPIDVKLGPDGALYIADWSNPIIQHGEVDFRDPRRDHEHGRIWRVSVKGKAALKRPDFDSGIREPVRGEPPVNFAPVRFKKLLEELISPNSFNRDQARRVLIDHKFLRGGINDKRARIPELGGAVPIRDMFNSWAVELRSSRDQLEALWLTVALDAAESTVAQVLLARLLNADDGRIRAAAVRVLGNWSTDAELLRREVTRVADASGSTLLPAFSRKPAIAQTEALNLLAKAVTDSHPRVRVEALRALSRIPTARSAELLLSAVDTIGSDPFLDYAVWLSINDLAPQFLAALESGRWSPDSPAKQKQLEFAMRSIEPALAASTVTKLVAGKPLPKDGGPWIELIGTAGGQAEINKLWEQVAAREFSDAALSRAFTALSSAARLRNVKPAGDGSRAAGFFYYATIPERVAALDLMGAWKNPGAAFVEMVKLARDERTPAEVRTATFAAFREIGAVPPVLGALEPLTERTLPAAVRRPAALTLASLQPAKFAAKGIEAVADSSGEAEAEAAWRSLLATKGAGKALAGALGSTAVSESAAKAGMRVAREGGRTEPELVAALTKLAKLDVPAQTITPELIKQIAASAAKSGDAARGELVYRRAALGCVLCHSIGGAGGKVGPDMTSIGASAPADYLVESLFMPNAKIKEGFHSTVITTKDDLEFSGLLVRETPQEVILRNAQNQEVSVAKNNIARRANSQLSLMPTGLLDTMPDNERLDLVAFLSALGKPGNFDASKGGVARVWRVLPVTHRMGQDGIEPFVKGDFAGKWDQFHSGFNGGLAWGTTTTLVNGSLPKDDFAELAKAPLHVTVNHLVAGTTFTASKAGPVTLVLDGNDKPDVWLDGKPVKPAANGEIRTTVAAGAHTVVLRFDSQRPPASTRLRSADVTFATN
jgi:putative heme-binding domain-containing protein